METNQSDPFSQRWLTNRILSARGETNQQDPLRRIIYYNVNENKTKTEGAARFGIITYSSKERREVTNLDYKVGLLPLFLKPPPPPQLSLPLFWCLCCNAVQINISLDALHPTHPVSFDVMYVWRRSSAMTSLWLFSIHNRYAYKLFWQRMRNPGLRRNLRFRTIPNVKVNFKSLYISCSTDSNLSNDNQIKSVSDIAVLWASFFSVYNKGLT